MKVFYATGATGAQGPTGPAGKTIWQGSGAPSNGLGEDGDVYIDSDTWELYSVKASGAWPAPISLIGPAGSDGADGATGPQGDAGPQGAQGPQGIQGPAGNDGSDGADGIDGRTLLSGTVVPTTEGDNGDFYIKTDTSDIYGPKTGGSWGSPTSLIGAQGPQGPAGNDGAAGAQGPQGVKGDTGDTGATGADGADGADGRTIHNGSGAPAAGLGEVDDLYIDTTNDTYYVKVGASDWGSATSLIGPQGPQGDAGATGSQGPAGNDGADGQGVPIGGGAGQLLAKIDGTDFNTEWVDPSASGLTSGDIDTLAELNSIVTDATLIDTGDSRLSDARTPLAHTHTLADLSDFSIDTPINGHIFQYNTILSKWENVPASTIGLQASDIDTLAELNGIVSDATLIDTNDSRLSDARTPTSHTHPISEVTNLQTTLDGKAASSHTHTESDITDLQAYLLATDINTLAKVNAIITDATLIDTGDSRLSDARTPTAHTHTEADITDLKSYLLASDIDTLAELNAIITDATLIDTADSRLSDARTPLAHSHAISDTTGLQAALDGKASSSHTHTESDITDLQDYLLAADINTLAKVNAIIADATLIDTGDSRLSDARTPTAHNHAAADINSGTFVDARIAASNVTQHQAALSITESQISDLGAYLTSVDVGDLNTTGTASTSTFLRGDMQWVAVGGGSALEVEDEGVSLSTAVTKINFVGAGVTATEPVADEITVTIAGGAGVGQLNELSDVNTSTPTNRNALVADGTDWESRALVQDDISDLPKITVGTSAPGSPATGDLWVDTN